MNGYVLWGTQVVYIALIVVNTWAWGIVIRRLGQIQPSFSFLWRLSTDPYFLAAMLCALFATVVTYYARASLGIVRGNLFYSAGTVALVLTGKYALGEGFTWQQLVGIAFIMAGVVLLS